MQIQTIKSMNEEAEAEKLARAADLENSADKMMAENRFDDAANCTLHALVFYPRNLC